MDAQSIVNRHKRLIEWLTSAVADITDKDLATPQACELEDGKLHVYIAAVR